MICIATGSRAEWPLLQPIARRIRRSKKLRLGIMRVNPAWSLYRISRYASARLSAMKPDILIVPTDRREMVPVAMTAFYMNIPVFHFLGGIYTFSGTWDDVGRHVISCFSHIIFCESRKAKERLVKAGEEPWRCIITGTTHFDDLEIRDKFRLPPKSYDVLLMNPLTLSKEQTRREIKKALSLIDRDTFIIYPNEDIGREVIIEEIDRWIERGTPRRLGINVHVIKESLPRSVFLGLLSKARRFISNSSSTVYEAPYFGIEVVNPSMRNSERDLPLLRSGAADKIARFLENVRLDDRLLKKRLRAY